MAARSIDPFLVQFYDGLDSPVEFEKVFAVTAAMQDWDDAKTLKNIPFFLRGKAKRVYDDLTIKDTLKKVFDELKLKCAVSREQLVERFHARRRNAGESIARFAEALCTLLSAAMPGLDADIRSSLLKTQLCHGVPDNVKALVNFNRALSWDELIAALDRSFPTSSADEGGYASGLNSHPMIKSEPAEFNWTNTDSGRGREPPRPNGGNRRPGSFTGTCHHCGLMGHRWVECRSRMRGESRADGGRGSGGFHGDSGSTSLNNSGSSMGDRSQYERSFHSAPQGRDRRFMGSGGDISHNNTSASMYSQWDHHEPDYSQFLGHGSMQPPSGYGQFLPPLNSTLASDQLDNGRQSHNNFIAAKSSSKQSNYTEFPGFDIDPHIDSHMVKATAATIGASRGILLKAQVGLRLFGCKEQSLIALIDGGSTHSFISPSVLSNCQLQIANSRDSKHELFSITSATVVVNAMCCVSTASISIGPWIGSHRFVISSAVANMMSC